MELFNTDIIQEDETGQNNSLSGKLIELLYNYDVTYNMTLQFY